MTASDSTSPNASLPVEPPVVQLRLCRTCGAICQTNETVCWMCRSGTSGAAVNPYRATPEIVTAELVSDSEQEGFFAVLLVICLMAAILVGVGIGVQDPGLLIAYLILIGPAFMITGVRAASQTMYRGGPKPKALLASLFISFGVTIGIIGLLVVASIALLFLLCIGILTQSQA